VARGPLFRPGLQGLQDWEQAATNGDMYAMRRARDLYYYDKKHNDPTRLRGLMWALILRDKGDPWDTTARIIELFKEQLTRLKNSVLVLVHALDIS
jgi:hypothetical protein